MTGPDPHAVLPALGISPEQPGIEPDGDRWLTMLDVATDPATDPVDPALAPTMDDDQTYPDDDVATPAEHDVHDVHDDGQHEHPELHHPGPLDHDATTDEYPGSDHHVDLHDDPGHHDSGPWHG